MGKTKFKTLVISLSLAAAAAVCLSLAFVACSGGEEKRAGKYGAGEEGIYYYDATTSEEYLMTLQSGTYMISVGGTSGYSGTYSYDEDAASVSFTGSDGSAFDASFTDDVMQLEISGTPYTFLRKVDYTVSFMDGSTSVGTQSVTYGKSAEKLTAEKDGYIFIGWYEDAAFTTKYTFNTAVTGNLTLYAYYIEEDPTVANFEIQFVSGGDVIYTTTTQNGVVYDFPVTDVDGWWVSATNSEGELTYRYDGETLTEATKLFAVKGAKLGASVYGDRIEWEASVTSATITVDGNVITSSATGTSYVYDFDALSTGRHEITITGSGATENLVYVTNGLSRVSNFAVYGTTLVYNKVENAQCYYISVTCANPSHDHTMVYNGNTLTYDFSNCEMGPDGITFTVYAYAQGYETSVSETFVYALILGGTTVTIDSATDTASWTAVSGATGYEVYVNGEYAETVTGTSYSFKYEEKNAEIEIAVKPVANGYYSEISGSAKYTKTTLRTPEITGISDYGFTWDKVEGAEQYELSINGYVVIIDKNADGTLPTEYVLSSSDMEHIFDTNVITITAIGDANSQGSDLVYVTDTVMSSAVTYADGTVTWAYALAADAYTIEVDGAVQGTVTGVNSFDVTFTHSGDNVIKIYFDDASYASLTVYTYAVIFDVREYGDGAVDTIYVAKGDTLSLPVPASVTSGVEFVGWYTLPADFDADAVSYLGDGYEVASGSVFDKNETMILFASWIAEIEDVVLSAGDVGFVNGSSLYETNVSYGSSTFTLPVPDTDDVTYVFTGWYSEDGIKYTDGNGKAVRTYDNTEAVTLHAGWAKAVDFTLTTYQGQQVLSAYAGDGISYVSEVTVPATYAYNGTEYPVAVIGSTAFSNISTLVTVNIPDTIKNITLTNNGNMSGSGAFAGSDNIENVNVYATGDEPDSTKEVTYYSEDGVLFMKNLVYGYMELIYYPQGRDDYSYTIPSVVSNIYECDEFGNPVEHEVKSIATQVFRYKNVYEVVVPCTVTNIEAQAFYYSYARTVIFDGGAGDPLKIGSYAFQNSYLVEITLPARLESYTYNMFTNCSSLVNVFVDGQSGTLGSLDGVLCDVTLTTIIYYPAGRTATSYVVPEGVTTIGENSFQGNSKICGVTIASTVTRICTNAFVNDINLSEIVFLGTAESSDLYIETLAFSGCTGLTSVTLPANLTGLEAYAFSGCRNLTEVTYDSRPNATAEDLAGLEDYAFSSSGSTSANSYVVTLNLGANVPEINFGSIFGGDKLLTVNIAEGNENFSSIDGVVFDAAGTSIYYFPLGWRGEYVIPDGVETIERDVFAGRAKLTGITIPASVTTIAANAFMNCTGLSFVTFAKAGEDETDVSLTIGDSVFSGCSALAYIELPARTLSVGTGVFDGCTILEEIAVETGCEHYTSKDGILYSMSNGQATTLVVSPVNNKNTKIEIISTITEIADSAFANNANILEISFDGEVDPQSFSLGANAFSGCTKLQKVTLPVGLTTIASNTFLNCTSLLEVVIPSSVTKIEKSAFYGCTVLATVTFDEDTEEERTEETKLVIESGTSEKTSGTAGAFYNCKALTSISLPKYTDIGDYTFYNCTALTSFTVPEGTTAIPQYCFYGCTALAEINLDGITAIGAQAIRGCTALTSIEIPGTVSAIPEYCFYGDTKLASIEIKGTITEIGTYAFYNCSALTSFDIPEGITTLNNNVFSGTGLTTLNIPASLETINSYNAITNMASLTTITVDEGNEYFGVKDNVLYGLTDGVETTLWLYPIKSTVTEITVPKTVTAVNGSAFGTSSNKSNVVKITFEDGVSQDPSFSDSQAFQYCSALDTVILPEGMTELSQSLFRSSTVKSVTIPSTVTTIGYRTFESCTSLTTVTFTDGGTEALVFATNTNNSYGAFYKCTALKEIEFPERTTTLQLGMCNGCTSLAKVTIGAKVTVIPNRAFYNCSALTEVVFTENSTLTEIEQYAFNGAGASGLEFVCPDTLTTIGNYVFQNSKMTSITLNEGLQTIGSNAFMGTTLTSINIPSTVASIGSAFIQNNTSLTSLTFTSGGTADLAIGNSLCYGCTKITSITIPARVVSLGTSVFYNCSALTTVTFEGGSRLESIGQNAFYKTGLTSFAFPESSSTTGITLGATIFSGCTALTELHISSGVTELGTALDSCTSIVKVTVAEGNTAFAADDTGSVLYTSDKTEIVRLFGQLTGTYEIPASVTVIEANAFQSQTSLVGVVIHADVASLGNYAFDGCSALATVTIASGARIEAGNYVFQNCSSLTSIDCTGIVSFGTYAFYGCSNLASVTLDEGLTMINDRMFQNCSSLKSVNIPEGVTYIGVNAFYNTAIESVTIPEGVVHMGTSAGTEGSVSSSGTVSVFDMCSSLTTVVLSSITETIGGLAFQNCSNLRVITYTGDPNYDPEADYSETGYCAFPETMKLIGYGAFQNCGLIQVTVPAIESENLGQNIFAGNKSLVSVSFADGMETVSSYMFNGCTSLETITLTGITEIQDNAFRDCTALMSADLSDAATLTGEGIFRGCTALASAIWGSALTSIPGYTFYGCTNLYSVTGVDAVTSVGQYAFHSCSSLASLGNTARITEVATYAFYGCSEFYNFTVFDGCVESIGSYAFVGCAIMSADLSAVQTISDYAFQNCASLQSVIYSQTAASIPAYAFDGCTSLLTIGGTSYAASVGSYAFRNCSSLISVDIADAVTIGDYAFYGCVSLVLADTGTGLTTISQYAFYGCESLAGISIPSTATTIGNYAFYGCASLESVDVPVSVTSVGTYCFYGCTSLKDVNLMAKYATLPDYTFYGCTSLEHVELSGSVTSIGQYAFYECASLTEITLPEGVTTIGNYAFEYSGLTSITIPTSVTTINQYAFAYSALETVVFEGNPTTIGNYAFAYCESLASVEFSDTYTTIGSYMFAGCTAVESIDIPSSVTSVGASAFDGWTEDQTINVGFEEGEIPWTSGWNTGCGANIVYAESEETKD